LAEVSWSGFKTSIKKFVSKNQWQAKQAERNEIWNPGSGLIELNCIERAKGGSALQLNMIEKGNQLCILPFSFATLCPFALEWGDCTI
jgi:hypothetical protein